MYRPAFSLIEILLVIGVIGIVTALTIPAFRRYQVRSDLDNATQQITQSLGRARILSVSGERDATWGVYVPGAVLFKGKSYALRDPSFDEMYPVSPAIALSGLQEVVFSRLEGSPSATGSIILTALSGDMRQINIIIDKEGIPTTSEDKITICHKPKSICQTMKIPDNAWPGHQGHGDHMGVCHC